MASEAQIKANKENSQKSTGPTSIEGKKKYRMWVLKSPLPRKNFKGSIDALLLLVGYFSKERYRF
jgi:hypothetical protein